MDLEQRIAFLENAVMQINENNVRTDLKLSAYISFLIKRNMFALDELESVKYIVESEINKMKQPVEVEQDKKES